MNEKRYRSLKLTGGLLTFAFALFAGNNAYAQSFAGLSISPTTFELSGNPGDSVENVVKVTNHADRPITLTSDRRNFAAIGEEGSVGLTEEETSFSLAKWISITPETATVGPGQSQIFTFVTNVPANAEPGGHFGSLVFRTGGAQGASGSGASVAQEVASLVLFRVAGATKEAASIIEFKPGTNFYEYGPIDFEIRVKNDGNVHVKPTGTVTITNVFGKKVADVSIEPKNVLPGAIRKNTVVWEEKNLFGKYSATASLTYGNDNTIITATTTFVSIPYKTVAAVTVVILIIAALMIRARKRLAMAARVLFGKQN